MSNLKTLPHVRTAQVILKGRAKWSARYSMWRTGRLPFKNILKFAGPRFDISRASSPHATLQAGIVGNAVHVIVDRTEYVYPLDTVGRAKITHN